MSLFKYFKKTVPDTKENTINTNTSNKADGENVNECTKSVNQNSSSRGASHNTDSYENCQNSDSSLPTPDAKRVKTDFCPKHNASKGGRSFQKEWLNKFKWLRYSAELDKAFCYACKTFQPFGTKETTYISTGFACWKNALDKRKGFPAHELTRNHLIAFSMWKEKEVRDEKNQFVSTLVNEKILEDNRYYLSSIVEMIQFLASNELPFRGTYNTEEHSEHGLFINFYEYTLKKDSKLAEIAKRIPKNATYLSPAIQNNIIDLMTSMVRNDVAKNVQTADVPWYTLFMDGTRNKQMAENIAFGIRYVKDGKVKEQTLAVEVTKNSDAISLANLVLNVLGKCNLDTKYLLSQCYDGASVMCGKKGGVQAIIQDKLNRKIPYVHCYNHRLHLVVVEVITVDAIQQFFSHCAMLYNFLKKGNVRSLYEGNNLVRLLQQRWSGHYEVVMTIFENFKLIIQALMAVKMNDDKKFDGEDNAVSIGLLHVVTSENFCFCLVFMRKFLGVLHPADKVLQSHDTSLKKSSEIVNVVYQTLKNLRTTYDEFDSVLKESQNLAKSIEGPQNREQRLRKKSTMLQDHIVYEYINEPCEMEIGQSSNTLNHLRCIYNETLDMVLHELEKRFTDNKELIAAISAVDDLSIDTKSFAFLEEFGIEIPQREEIIVAQNYLNNFKIEGQTFDFIEKLYDVKDAFPKVYNLVATSRVFGCSTAICESTFSVLTRIDRSQRQCMTSQREANLVLLGYEKNTTKHLDVGAFLKNFNNQVDRKLQLF